MNTPTPTQIPVRGSIDWFKLPMAEVRKLISRQNRGEVQLRTDPAGQPFLDLFSTVAQEASKQRLGDGILDALRAGIVVLLESQATANVADQSKHILNNQSQSTTMQTLPPIINATQLLAESDPTPSNSFKAAARALQRIIEEPENLHLPSPVSGDVNQNPAPCHKHPIAGVATTCLNPDCYKDPCEWDDEGYSKCCGVYFETKDADATPIFKRADPIANHQRKKLTQYRGVTRVIRRSTGNYVYRVQIRRASVVYHICEVDNELAAAECFDNAIWFLAQVPGFFREGNMPALNFPDQYINAKVPPLKFQSTRKLLDKISTQKFLAGQQTVNAILNNE